MSPSMQKATGKRFCKTCHQRLFPEGWGNHQRKHLNEYVTALEAALAFYADREHWVKDSWGVLAVIADADETHEYGDPGKLARSTLRKRPRDL